MIALGAAVRAGVQDRNGGRRQGSNREGQRAARAIERQRLFPDVDRFNPGHVDGTDGIGQKDDVGTGVPDQGFDARNRDCRSPARHGHDIVAAAAGDRFHHLDRDGVPASCQNCDVLPQTADEALHGRNADGRSGASQRNDRIVAARAGQRLDRFDTHRAAAGGPRDGAIAKDWRAIQQGEVDDILATTANERGKACDRNRVVCVQKNPGVSRRGATDKHFDLRHGNRAGRCR